MMLASTAKTSPPTIPSFMQRATTVSNSLRSRSLSRNGRGGSWKTSNDQGRRRRDPIDKTSDKPVEVDLVAQPPLRANAKAVAHDQHADHQLGIDRGPSHIAVIAPQMRP